MASLFLIKEAYNIIKYCMMLISSIVARRTLNKLGKRVSVEDISLEV